jgi:copper chaperone CopZ
MRNKLTAAAAAVTVAAALLAAVACGGPDTVRTVFTIEGMHCDACSSAITAALEKTPGVVEASADYERGTAVAVYHSREAEAETLKAEIEKLGYTVTGMTTEAVNV